MERITGLPAPEVLGQAIWDVQFRLGFAEQQTPAWYGQLKTTIQSLLRSGPAPWPGQVMEREYRHPDGANRFVQGMVFPIQTDQGFMLGSVSRDVTAHRQAEAALRESEETLRAFVNASPQPRPRS